MPPPIIIGNYITWTWCINNISTIISYEYGIRYLNIIISINGTTTTWSGIIDKNRINNIHAARIVTYCTTITRSKIINKCTINKLAFKIGIIINRSTIGRITIYKYYIFKSNFCIFNNKVSLTFCIYSMAFTVNN